MSPRPIEFPVEGLSDGVVSLRLLTESDLPGVIEAVGDPLIPRYTTVPDPYGEREARQWQRSSSQGIAAGTDLATVIVDADDGQLLGAVGLHGIGSASGRCSAGYWLAAAARGKGLATRAVRLLCRYAFAELRRRQDRAVDRTGEHRLAGGGRTGGVRARGADAVFHADPRGPPRHAHVLVVAKHRALIDAGGLRRYPHP